MIQGAVGSLSLRAWLTVWYTFVLLAILVVFAATVVWQQGRIGIRRVDRELDALTSTLKNVLGDELDETAEPLAAAAEANSTMGIGDDQAMAILDRDGGVLAATWHGFSVAPRFAPSDAALAWTAETARGAWRVHVVPASMRGETFYLLSAAPLGDVLRERHEAQEAMWVAIPIALLLSVAGGLWLASVGLRPITDMARRAEALAPAGVEDLGESGRRDELGQLARAFNGLVARLRQALQTQRQFMADASHELRTPVSVIQSAADVALSRDRRSEAEYRETLEIVGIESRRVASLVDDMLVLARADAGGYPLRPVSLYLNELMCDCQRTLAVVARARGVALCTSATEDVPFHGDEDLLRRMILNLVKNAISYTRCGGTVTIEIAPDGGRVQIRVRDEGPGIAPEHRARIFERFVQLDAARRSGGAGLGLPIARWIAETHGGSLDIEESGPSGTTFRVILPFAVS